MSTDAEKLAQIAALCDDREHGPGPGWVAVDEVRAVLAEPGPDVDPVAFTREGVRTELLASLPADPKWVAWVEGVLDRVEVAEGVTLTREEAWVAADALHAWNEAGHITSRAVDVAALAARLEESS